MPKRRLSPEDYHVIELGKRHQSEEAARAFRPDSLALLHEVSKLFSVYLRQNEEHSLRQSRRQLLFFLLRNDGCVQQDMVKDTHLSAPMVSTELCDMEREGLITRKKDENDARAIRIHLTDKGRKITTAAREHFHRLSENALSPLTKEARAALSDTLITMRDYLIAAIDE